ncbi:MAG: DNA adenine methylase [Sulfuricurvum sp.]|nr:DNA adenine methylase [Sulfuricurvum sp.]
MVKMKTPITYWGGKQQLVDKILPLIPPHRQYNEPFFGGGAIFFAKNPSEIEFINDINGEMVNFYKTMKRKFDELKDEVDCTLHSEWQHKQARDIYSQPLTHSDVLRAWAVWMLSKQSIFAILTNGWRVSIDSNMAKQVQWSKERFTHHYARRLEHTSIFSRDAKGVILATDTDTTFHYVDPPYFNSECGHYSGYSEQDFIDLLDILSKIKGRFLMSSYPSKTLEEHSSINGWKTISIEMNKSSGEGNKTEVLTMNYDFNKSGVQRELF